VQSKKRHAAIALVIGIMLQRTPPAGFIAPCLPTKTDNLPSGSQWLHEIKHDGFRIVARKDAERVRLVIMLLSPYAIRNFLCQPDEIVGHPPHSGNVFKIAADQRRGTTLF
jgi:hypothetical protein